jgi:two-component system nitrogen regulation response regulator GlnG
VRRAAIALAAEEPVSLHALVGHVDAVPSRHPAHGAAPAGSAPSLPSRSRKRLETLSDDDVLDAMERNGWQILAASRALGISRPSLYKLLESHSCIRPADAIAAAELRDAWLRCGGDATRCASVLRTPGDALRRRLREEGLID